MDTQKFKSDVIWNFMSIIVLGVSGLGLNILIGYVYDASALGVFNQALAAYIVFSQLGTLGINLSALKLLPEELEDHLRSKDIVTSSLILVALSGGLFTLLLWISAPLISRLMDSPDLEEAIKWIVPGLFFFCINKVYFAVLNGTHKMKAFSIFTSIRYGNLLIALFIAIFVKMPSARLSYVFSFSEGILFFLLFFYLRDYKTTKVNNLSIWLKRHLNFGYRSMMAGTLLDLNSRIDVLMIGYLLSDEQTGIYSFAAMFAEGVLQLLVVLQNNYNPYISKFLYDGKHEELLNHFRNGRKMIYKYSAILAPIIIFCYPIGVEIVTNKDSFGDSVMPFAILIGGLFVASGYYPFHNILMLGLKPGIQTLFIFMMAGTNLLFNYLLIPIFGISGAAMGSAIALMSGNIYLILLSKKYLNIRLI